MADQREHKSGEELVILEQISQLDLTEWKEARNKIIKMLKEGEKKLAKVGKDTGGVKTAVGGVSAASGLATIAGVLTLNPFLFAGGML